MVYTQNKTHIIAVILKAAGEERIEIARQLTEAAFSCRVITSDWEKSFILNLYKGKAEALDWGKLSWFQAHISSHKAAEIGTRLLHP